VLLATVTVFASLIAAGTILSVPLPPPLYEITWAPAVYLALSALVDPATSFTAVGLGSFIGETYNIATRGGPPIFIPGIVWARAPEALIVGWARKKGWKALAAAMVLATFFETAAFFFPDWGFYSYGLFYGSDNTGTWPGFAAALPDLFTVVDLVFIPAAFVLIRAAAPAFKRLGFE